MNQRSLRDDLGSEPRHRDLVDTEEQFDLSRSWSTALRILELDLAPPIAAQGDGLMVATDLGEDRKPQDCVAAHGEVLAWPALSGCP